MKILQVATSTEGGAGIAARRLNSALNSAGFNSTLITGSAQKIPLNMDEIRVKKNIFIRNLSRVITVMQQRFLQRSDYLMTPFSLNTLSAEEIIESMPDVIHIHTFYNLLSSTTLSELCESEIPIFITLHDERFFTGGCHYALDCVNFENNCNSCPETTKRFQGAVRSAQDGLAIAFNRNHRPSVIAPSEWIAGRARRSRTLGSCDVATINNPLDLNFVNKTERNRVSREPSRPYLVTFIAQDLSSPFKGIQTILDCIEKYKLEFEKSNIKFVFVGMGLEIQIGNLKFRQYPNSDPSWAFTGFSRSDLFA